MSRLVMEKSGRKESQSLETVRPIIKLLLRSNMFKQNLSHTHTHTSVEFPHGKFGSTMKLLNFNKVYSKLGP